jgi:Protein of unknown function (DUF2846)
VRKFAFALSSLAILASTPASADVSTITTKSGAIGQPPAGMGQVIFYRTSVMGALLGCTARENNVELARLGVGKYYVVPLTPGVHQFSAKSIESKDQLRIEAEPGETYYVKCSISMGFMSGHPKLSPSDEASFAKDAAGLQSWTGPKAINATGPANATAPASAPAAATAPSAS